MPPLAYFGIESKGLNLAVDLLILFVAVLYFALIYWTYADARRRITDPMLVGCAAAAALIFPFVGAVVYMIVRPPEYLEDVHERELEVHAAQARLHQLEQMLCPHCDYRIEREFVRCPSCLRKLKERCVNCNRPLDQAWTICPYCEADVPGVGGTRVRRRRGASALEADRLEIGQSDLDATLLTDAEQVESAAPVAAVEPVLGQGERRPAAGGRAVRPSGRSGTRPRPTP
jgi:Double zinc ribbon